MKPSLRDVGLFLLGAGILLFSVIVLHFYVTQVLPHTGAEASLSVYCDGQGDRFFVYINNYGGAEFREVSVMYNDSQLCSYSVLTPGSSVVCTFSSDENFPIVEVSAVFGGRETVKSAVCRKIVVPRMD